MPLLVHRGDLLDPAFERYRQDLSDVLLSSLYPMPPGYDLHPRTRHDRRRNKALMRDWLAAIPVVPIGKEA